jgi:lipoate-protein ligase A
MAPNAHPFRLLETGFRGAYYNMGLDEALLEAVAAGNSLPVLRLYGWNPPAVSLGCFQGLEEEVDLPSCRARGVDVVRRISGGGAVFHYRELTYSLIMPVSHPLAGGSIRDSYSLLCAGIIAGLARLGVEASFVPINDIVSGGKKVSGSAQTRRQNCLLQHGTILLETDVDLMFSLLKVPQEKLKGKLIADVKERVAGLENILGRVVSFEESALALARGFSEALSLDFSAAYSGPAGLPSPAEDSRARQLAEEKFASPDWLRRR